jgi:hypothetical protein
LTRTGQFSRRLLTMDSAPNANKRSWRNSEFVCALADNVRHLGHLVMTEKWHAFDATHENDAPTSFKYLGAFVGLTEAKQAVESSVAGPEEQLRWAEDGGFTN